MDNSITHPKTDADFLQHSNNLVITAGTLDKHLELGAELKLLIDRQYLLNEALEIGDSAEGYNQLQIKLTGISPNFCSSNHFKLMSETVLSKKVLQLISKETRDRIVELKTILKID